MSISNLIKSIWKFILTVGWCLGFGLAFLAALVFLGFMAKLYAQFFMLGWNLGPSLFKNFL